MAAIDDVIAYLEQMKTDCEAAVRYYAKTGEVSYDSGYSQGDLDSVLDTLAYCKGLRDNWK